MSIVLLVEVNPDLHAKAEFEFGHDERPDYNDFQLGPLAAVVFACEVGKVQAHPLPNYPGVFSTVVPASGLFAPVAFTLALLDGGTLWHIYDYVVDHLFWDLVALDPTD